MKKILNYLFITVVIASFIGCLGMPESRYSSPSENSALIGGNQQEIVLTKIGNGQQNELIGLWKAKKVENSTHSQIQFDENGNLQEDVYSNLTGEKIDTIEGQYTTQNDRLEISIIKGNIYQFEFTLKSGQLNLKSLSN